MAVLYSSNHLMELSSSQPFRHAAMASDVLCNFFYSCTWMCVWGGEDDDGGVKVQYVQWAGVSGNSHSRPFLGMKSSDSCSWNVERDWTLELKLTIPIPVPKLEKSFPLNPDSEALDDNVIKWELEDGRYQKSLHLGHTRTRDTALTSFPSPRRVPLCWFHIIFIVDIREDCHLYH